MVRDLARWYRHGRGRSTTSGGGIAIMARCDLARQQCQCRREQGSGGIATVKYLARSYRCARGRGNGGIAR